ncbi:MULTISPECIES: alpha/beta hydrolase [Pimelobacter]|uniref:alpha/beta hydrolase n=1 Tax=Pimelobacter TaxID=2044 RepID=UPI001C04ECB4|nr:MULTISPECIES: alpha/beta fold hydrolase [Pimelobacter]MBU2696913.1 alpha/beta hydrolase [Pimelobacter sp. 30-1]UUW87268.1 lysophospholipase [Pimelobacter simplex]UUW96774.1 lysophospholipase [Pimelobacter simplex]
MPDGRALTDRLLPADPRALVLVLHGGADRSTAPLGPRSGAWRRSQALARHLAPTLLADDIGIVVLRYGVKGWNAGVDELPSPVPDARWALDEITAEHDVPVAIVGHSMGARTGVAVADHPSVRGVVALAPWLPADDPITPLTGKVLRAAHGRLDRITSPRATRKYVERAAAVADTEFTDMGPIGHYMLRRVPLWNAVTAASVREILAR